MGSLTWRRAVCALLLGVLVAGTAAAQLRVVTWNLSNYTSGRADEIRTVVYGSFEGRSMSPDVILFQEFISASSPVLVASYLNAAPGSPGDWVAAPFLNGPDTDNACVYRSSKIADVDVSFIVGDPRNVHRYDLTLTGYDGDDVRIACYSSHMKAGSSGSDQSRRLFEAQQIVANVNTLPAHWEFLLGGDFNIQSATQAAYVTLVGSPPNVNGPFFDPIDRAGPWNNNSTYRVIHTQDPSGPGGMDDRHDQILVGPSLVDGSGFEYIGDHTIPYSLTNWNDLNHSYRAWGNDGFSFNANLRTTGNTMVGPVIAQAIRDAAVNGGHIPVFLDLRVPAKIDAPSSLDFGVVPPDSVATVQVTVTHTGDIGLWGFDGIADLNYSLSTTAGFSAPAGNFALPPGGSTQHTITMDTSIVGEQNGTLTITSDAPENPVLNITLTGIVDGNPPCDGDINLDSVVDSGDLNILLSEWGFPCATPPDCNGADFFGDGGVTSSDLNIVLGDWGCTSD